MRNDLARFLESLKARNLGSNVPSVSFETAECLSGLVRESGAVRILEL